MRPRGFIIHAFEFHHAFGPWRDAHVVRRHGAAGVRRFAFVMPAGFPRAGTASVERPAIVPTRWFVDRDEALRRVRARERGEDSQSGAIRRRRQ